MKKHGCLTGTIENIMERSWEACYRWMMAQLKARIGPDSMVDISIHIEDGSGEGLLREIAKVLQK